MPVISRPVDGAVITRNFARTGANAHTGTDLVGEPGFWFKSPCDGTVVATGTGEYWAGHDLGWNYGHWIVIRDDAGYEHFLAHAGAIVVSAGHKVSRGEHVGNSGPSGNETGIHCHWSVYKTFPDRATLVDPESYRKAHSTSTASTGAVTILSKPLEKLMANSPTGKALFYDKDTKIRYQFELGATPGVTVIGSPSATEAIVMSSSASAKRLTHSQVEAICSRHGVAPIPAGVLALLKSIKNAILS